MLKGLVRAISLAVEHCALARAQPRITRRLPGSESNVNPALASSRARFVFNRPSTLKENRSSHSAIKPRVPLIVPEEGRDAIIVSLTHVRMHRFLRLAAAAFDYQKPRVKKRKKQNKT